MPFRTGGKKPKGRAWGYVGQCIESIDGELGSDQQI